MQETQEVNEGGRGWKRPSSRTTRKNMSWGGREVRK